MSDYFLFSTPSFLEGVARTLDLGGIFDSYNSSQSPQEADSRAIFSDWQSVGQDLWETIEKIDNEKESKPT